MTRLVLALLAVLAFCVSVEAQTCRSHQQWAKNTFGRPVQALQHAEEQLLQRYIGEPGPSYGDLAARVQRLGDEITRRAVTEGERGLRGCRNFVPSYRRTCSAAAYGLLAVVSEVSGGELSETTRVAFAESMKRCELWLGVPRRQSLLRMP